MFFQTSHFSRLYRPQTSKSTGEIHNKDDFAVLLQRERSRTDRTEQPFSMIVFEIHDLSDSTYRMLLSAIKSRKRTTDEVGLMDDFQMGLILPGTDEEGAWCLALELSNTTTIIPLNKMRIYTYPPKGRDSTENQGPVSRIPETEIHDLKSQDQEKIHQGQVNESLMEIIPHHFPAWKRAMDLFGSIFILIVMFPILATIGIMIKLVSSGPIIFRQERIGYLGRPFCLWKFRTMRTESDTRLHRDHLHKLIHADVPLTKLDDVADSRIIPFGKVLRMTGLDELPQLFNVIRGEMSLIGPRPCIPYEVMEYQPWQRLRVSTMPGLTGLWQVSGKNRTTHKEMIRLDIKYCRERSFWLDTKIMLKTIPSIMDQAGFTLSKKEERGYAT